MLAAATTTTKASPLAAAVRLEKQLRRAKREGQGVRAVRRAIRIRSIKLEA